MSLSRNLRLYLIALLPDDDIMNDITAFKNQMAIEYHSSHALKSPPHITLIPPFKREVSDEPMLKEKLDAFSATQATFEIELKHFSAFKPRVIYVDVVENLKLNALYEQINAYFKALLANDEEKGHKKFSPHITIAFRDLTRKMFYQAWEVYKSKSYTAAFEAMYITLLRHNGKIWEIMHHAPLGHDDSL